MSENIYNVCEKKEHEMGDAILARNTAMTNFIGLGPPDLVILEKGYTPPKMLGLLKHAKYSFFHWTLGNDVSSGAAVATYLGYLLENQEKQALGRGTYTIEKCITCSYNAFRKMDLRVEITVPTKKPSGYTIEEYAVDAIGQLHEVDEAFLKETYVCAMLRLIEGPPATIRPLRIKDSLNDPAVESRFLSLCAEVFPQANKLGNPDNGYSLYGVDASNNLLTSTICKYFIGHNRFEHMLTFFDNFVNDDAVSAVPIAYAETMLDRSSRAMSLLENSLRRQPDSPSIMLSIAELGLLNLPFGLDRHIKLLEILKTALNGISLQPNLSRGWWILAKCLIEMGRNEWSLVVMNNAPVVNENFDQHVVDVYGNPPFEKFTTPELTIPHISIVLQNEEKDFKEEFGDTSLRLLAAPNITIDEKTVYTLLSDIISRSSWDHLTKIRTRVLVRPAEMERARTRFARSESQAKLQQTAQPVVEEVQSDAPSEEPTPVPLCQSVEVVDAGQKDDGKASSMQQSSEYTPADLEEREQDHEDSKEDVPLTNSEIDSSQETLHTSTESFQESSGKQFSAPSFSISRDLDVDEALTQFLVYVLATRNGIPKSDVPTTPMNIDVASSPMIPVRDISRNMDVAFHAIFQDIKAFHAWKEEEKKLGLVGLEAIPAKFITQRSVADWIRVASMCERLSFTKDAAKIYRMIELQHIRALNAIVALDADRGDIKSTLIDASSLLTQYTTKYKIEQPLPSVVNAIVKLVANHGFHKVRAMQVSIPTLHPLVCSVVQDTMRWKSKGFDC